MRRFLFLTLGIFFFAQSHCFGSVKKLKENSSVILFEQNGLPKFDEVFLAQYGTNPSIVVNNPDQLRYLTIEMSKALVSGFSVRYMTLFDIEQSPVGKRFVVDLVNRIRKMSYEDLVINLQMKLPSAQDKVFLALMPEVVLSLKENEFVKKVSGGLQFDIPVLEIASKSPERLFSDDQNELRRRYLNEVVKWAYVESMVAKLKALKLDPNKEDMGELSAILKEVSALSDGEVFYRFVSIGQFAFKVSERLLSAGITGKSQKSLSEKKEKEKNPEPPKVIEKIVKEAPDKLEVEKVEVFPGIPLNYVLYGLSLVLVASVSLSIFRR